MNLKPCIIQIVIGSSYSSFLEYLLNARYFDASAVFGQSNLQKSIVHILKEIGKETSTCLILLKFRLTILLN